MNVAPDIRFPWSHSPSRLAEDLRDLNDYSDGYISDKQLCDRLRRRYVLSMNAYPDRIIMQNVRWLGR